MTTKVIMPQMGESVFEGTLTKWLKKVGEAVVRDEPLFEISTDKVDSEIPSPATGILSEILVPEGKTIQVNTVVAIIGASTEEVAAPDRKQDSATRSVPEEIRKPEEAPKPEPSAPPATTETVKSGSFAVPVPPKPQSPDSIPAIRPQNIRTSPLVRKLARENNVDLSVVRGTGLEGRITKEDLLNYLKSVQTAAPGTKEAAPPGAGVSTEPVPTALIASKPPEVPKFAGELQLEPMTPMRKAIADHMILSKKTSAHVNTVFEVDMTAVVRLRESHKAEFQSREGIPLTYTPFFGKALVETVHEFPIFNSSLIGENIAYKKPVNLGIAVALDTGLIVPVIKDAHLKSFTGLALAVFDLADRARTKKLKPDDVQNGTISMTNPGSFGALFATPIINQPQVAILGIGGIEKRPVVINDAIAIRSMVCLSLTFDHRVIDGAVADRFMVRLKERLQTWTQWID